MDSKNIKIDNRPYLSVVIPAFNEERLIKRTLDDLRAYFAKVDYETEIIIVEDGSSDKTEELLKKEIEPGGFIRAIFPGENRGKALAIKRGIEEASGEFILFSDADQSTPIEEIEKLLKAADKEGTAKKEIVAIGSRCLKDSQVEIHQPFYREFMGRTFNYLVQLLAVPGITDTQCGFKLFPGSAAKEAFSRMTVTDFSFDVEIIAILRGMGYEVVEIPVIWKNVPQTRVKVLSDVPKMFIGILRVFAGRITGKFTK